MIDKKLDRKKLIRNFRLEQLEIAKELCPDDEYCTDFDIQIESTEEMKNLDKK